MKNNPLQISIVTVVFNGEAFLEKTIQSIINQTYENIEYIVIDGGSTDGTIDIIKKYQDKIAVWISEKDDGIYEAMNKGIELAHGKWINFMNAGDVFFSDNVLTDFYEKSLAYPNVDFFYSDVITEKKTRYECNKEKRILIHQAIIYKTAIHSETGKYITVKNITTADYFFFMLSFNYQWHKLEYPIAIYDTNGVSSGLQTFLQKNAIDLLFGFNGRLKTIVYLAIHPLYNFLKKKVFRR